MHIKQGKNRTDKDASFEVSFFALFVKIEGVYLPIWSYLFSGQKGTISI